MALLDWMMPINNGNCVSSAQFLYFSWNSQVDYAQLSVDGPPTGSFYRSLERLVAIPPIVFYRAQRRL
eukprot:scaffold8104_cov75-Cylindrotheca_fusiformis.AAC.2